MEFFDSKNQQGSHKSHRISYAYLMEWNEYMPKVLNDLLKDNIIAKVATQPFELNGKSMIMGPL
jgi:hypothetical protein